MYIVNNLWHLVNWRQIFLINGAVGVLCIILQHTLSTVLHPNYVTRNPGIPSKLYHPLSTSLLIKSQIIVELSPLFVCLLSTNVRFYCIPLFVIYDTRTFQIQTYKCKLYNKLQILCLHFEFQIPSYFGLLVIIFTYKSNMNFVILFSAKDVFIKVACLSMISSIHHSGTLHYMSLMCYLY